MRREVGENLLSEAAYLAFYPAVVFRGDVLADEGAWRYAIARATEVERVELLVGLGPHLLQATPGGIKRLQFFATYRATDIDPEPLLIGDPEFEPILKAALAMTPPVVRYAVLREAVFIGVGRSSNARTSSARFVDITGQGRTQMVVMGPTVDIPILLHEFGHVFTGRIPHDDSQAITVAGERDGYALAAAHGWSVRVDVDAYIAEVLADALALAWLYSPTPTPMVS